jgi:hypothetical protein
MMTLLEFLFYLFAGIVLYTYVGYGMVLWLMVKLKRTLGRLV